MEFHGVIPDTESNAPIIRMIKLAGRKKSALIVDALREYLCNHPEAGGGVIIQIAPSRDQIEQIIADYLKKIDFQNPSQAEKKPIAEQHEEAIESLIDDLSLFG